MEKSSYSTSRFYERNGVRIGVLGLTEPEAVEAPGAGELVHLLDPVTTAERLVPELRAQSDVVIVLSHLGLERDRQVARAVEGIDVIVGGVDGILPGEAQYQGRTLLVQAGYDGEWLGRVDLPLDGEAAGVDARATAVEMGPDVPDDPALAEIVAHWRALDPGVAAPSR